MHDRDITDDFFDAMLLSEDCGDVEAMLSHVFINGGRVTEGLNADRVREFAYFLTRLIDKVIIENRDGAQSLMNWDHPFNITMVEHGVLGKERYQSS